MKRPFVEFEKKNQGIDPVMEVPGAEFGRFRIHTERGLIDIEIDKAGDVVISGSHQLEIQLGAANILKITNA